jgi:ribonuclease P protein component
MRRREPPSRGGHETNLPTQQQASEENARIPRAHGDAGRAGRDQASAGEGAKAPDGLDPAEAAALRRGGQSFPAASRLRQRREFLRLERQGRRFAGIHFVLLTQLRSDEVRRLGVTASRRVGGSVVRNRVKRLVREVFRRSRESLPAADAVVIARPGAAGLSYGTVLDELTRLWKRAAERSSNR